MNLPSAAILTSLLLVAPALGESWQRYTNTDIGFTLSLPQDRFTVEQDSPGRLSLSERGGTARIDVFGVRNSERLSLSGFRSMIEAADPHRRVTYRKSGPSWFVLSGYLDEAEPTIFYAKFMLNAAGTELSAFEISYPESDKAEFNAVVERMEDSLTSPR